jgi:hypothetical protein
VTADAVAKWDGTQWSAPGSGIDDIWALTSFDDGTGRALYAGLIGAAVIRAIVGDHAESDPGGEWRSAVNGRRRKVAVNTKRP